METLQCRVCGGEFRDKPRKYRHKKGLMCYSCKRRKYQYNVSEKKLLELLSDPSCDICGKELDRFNACIDHDHETMEVRGVLCREHNLMLGYAKDSPAILSNAIKYLEQCNLEVRNS